MQLKGDVNGKVVKMGLEDKTTMKVVLQQPGVPHLVVLLPQARGKRKAEAMGGITKTRLAGDSETYVDGNQYDRLLQNPQLLKKFKENREFLKQLVGTDNVNLLRPHLIICYVCEKEITLGETGILLDFKKHLGRHKTDTVDLMTKSKAGDLLSRWEELKNTRPDPD